MCARYIQLPESNRLQCLSDLYLFLSHVIKRYTDRQYNGQKKDKRSTMIHKTLTVTEKTND